MLRCLPRRHERYGNIVAVKNQKVGVKAPQPRGQHPAGCGNVHKEMLDFKGFGSDILNVLVLVRPSRVGRGS